MIQKTNLFEAVQFASHKIFIEIHRESRINTFLLEFISILLGQKNIQWIYKSLMLERWKVECFFRQGEDKGKVTPRKGGCCNACKDR